MRWELRWDPVWSPCFLVSDDLETSLTLDLLILSQCQGALLHPVLVLTNYQACLTGEGCFNLVLWGLSLDDLSSIVPCVISASFQGGLCGSAAASPPASGPSALLIAKEVVDWTFGL